jgi:hypothetical protein
VAAPKLGDVTNRRGAGKGKAKPAAKPSAKLVA